MKAASNLTWIIGVIVIIALGFFVVGPILGLNFQTQQPFGPSAQTNCPDVAITAYSSAKNPLNSSIEYQAGRVVYTNQDGSSIIAADTMTAGASKASKSTTIPCTVDIYNNGIYAYAVADAARASAKSNLLKYNGATSITVDFEQADTDQVTMVMYGTTLSNTSSPSTGSKGTVSESAATAMSAGDSRSGYFDIWQATGKAQYGSDHDGLLWCIDTVTSAAFTDESVSLSSQTAGFELTPVSCDTYEKTSAVDSCNKCYKSRAIKATDSRIRVAWSMTNDGGTDCGSSDDPVLYIEDIAYFEDTDSTVKLGTHDSSGTNKGETQCSLTWANS